MICPYCKAENAASCVTTGGMSSTCIAGSPGYFDERGKWVRARDPNWHTTEYFCTRGHRYEVKRREGDADVVRLVSTLGGKIATSGASVLVVDPSWSTPNSVAVTPAAAPPPETPAPPTRDGQEQEQGG
jgi:hypothetical protein